MKLTTSTTAALVLALSSSVAFAGLNVGDQLGTSEEAIRAALEAQGAVVQEIETEDGSIEAEFTLDGADMEVEVDMASGAITEVETEDENDDGADEDDGDEDDADDEAETK